MAQQQPSSWLRASALAVISTLLTVFALHVSYDIYWREQPRKELQMVIESSAPMIQVQPGVVQDIKVFYKDVRVTNLNLLRVRLQNTGNQEIRISDFDEPIVVLLHGRAKILSVVNVTAFPTNVDAKADVIRPSWEPSIGVPGTPVPRGQDDHSGARPGPTTVGEPSPLPPTPIPTPGPTALPSYAHYGVLLSPTLLNAGDYIVIQMLVTDIPKESMSKPVDVRERIAGVSNIPILTLAEASQGQSTRGKVVNTAATFAFLLGVGIVAVILPTKAMSFIRRRYPHRASTWLEWAFFIIMGLLVLFLVVRVIINPFIRIIE